MIEQFVFVDLFAQPSLGRDLQDSFACNDIGLKAGWKNSDIDLWFDDEVLLGPLSSGYLSHFRFASPFGLPMSSNAISHYRVANDQND